MYERAGGSVSSNRRKRFDANGYQNVSIDRDHAFIYKLVCWFIWTESILKQYDVINNDPLPAITTDLIWFHLIHSFIYWRLHVIIEACWYNVIDILLHMRTIFIFPINLAVHIRCFILVWHSQSKAVLLWWQPHQRKFSCFLYSRMNRDKWLWRRRLNEEVPYWCIYGQRLPYYPSRLSTSMLWLLLGTRITFLFSCSLHFSPLATCKQWGCIIPEGVAESHLSLLRQKYR